MSRLHHIKRQMNSADRRRGLLRFALAGTAIFAMAIFSISFVHSDPGFTQSVSAANSPATTNDTPDDSSTTAAADTSTTTASNSPTASNTSPTDTATTNSLPDPSIDLQGTERPASVVLIETPYSAPTEVLVDITGEWSAHIVFSGVLPGQKFAGTITTEDGSHAFDVSV